MPARIAFWVGIAASASLGGYAGALVSDREMPVEVLSAHATLSHVKPGDTLRIEYTVTRRRSCGTKVDRLLYDAERVRYVLPDLDFPSGFPAGTETYSVPISVPSNMAPGKAFYRVISSYQCNVTHKLWPLVAPARDVHFEVLPH